MPNERPRTREVAVDSAEYVKKNARNVKMMIQTLNVSKVEELCSDVAGRRAKKN
jgi:hypothetical protein